MKKWKGSKPVNCELCGEPFKKVFFDAKTRRGPWGLICKTCHLIHGCGVGIGKGQEYDLKTLIKLRG